MPKQLPRADETTIKNRYGAQLQATTAGRSLEAQVLAQQEQAMRGKYVFLRVNLAKEEDAAKKSAEADVRNTHGRYAVQYSKLAETVRSVDSATADQLKEIDARLGKLQKNLASLRWRKETLRLESGEMAGVKFRRYLGRVFLGA